MNSNAKITYHQQVSYCGKPRCRKCREGKGHGPYWYSYQTVNGHTTRTYIGKNLPPGVQAMQESVPVNRAERVPPSTLPLSGASVENKPSARCGKAVIAWRPVDRQR